MPPPRLWQPPAWVPPTLFVAIGVTMLCWNPDAWLHPLVDYGRELYVPWRLAAGDVLYRDIAYFNGPLSPYLNAIWFSLFGANVHVLTAANVAVLAVACALLYSLVVAVSDRFAATLGGVVFLTMFGFQHFDYLGNFSWIAPYSHEMTHGVTLGLLAVWLVGRARDTGRRRWALACGSALGLGFLTKPETFAATGLAIGAALLVQGTARRGRDAGLITLGAVVPPLVAWALLATAMPGAAALQGVAGGFRHLLNERLTGLIYYAACRGTDDLGKTVELLLRWLVWYLVLLVPGVAFAWFLRPGTRTRSWITVALLCALPLAVAVSGYGRPLAALPVGPWIVGAGLLTYGVVRARHHVAALAATVSLPLAFTAANIDVPWHHAFRPLLLFGGLIGIGLGVAHLRRRDAGRGVVLWIFAMALLTKIFFYVRFNHYGFGLAAPLALVCVAAITCWVPRWLEARGWSGGILRGFGTGLTLLFVVAFLQLAAKEFADKSVRLTTPHESIRVRHSNLTRAARVSVQWLAENARPGETVTVFPEGIGINYFARRINPTGHINFMPPEVIMFRQKNILADLEAHPPDIVIMIHRSTPEYGKRLFGTHYGRRLKAWVDANYTPVAKFGAEPLHPDRLRDHRDGMWMLRRR